MGIRILLGLLVLALLVTVVLLFSPPPTKVSAVCGGAEW